MEQGGTLRGNCPGEPQCPPHNLKLQFAQHPHLWLGLLALWLMKS